MVSLAFQAQKRPALDGCEASILGIERLDDELHADVLVWITRRPPGAVVRNYKPGGLFMGVYMFADSLQAIEEDRP